MIIRLKKIEIFAFLVIGAALIASPSIDVYFLNALMATVIFILLAGIIENDSLVQMMFFLGFVVFIYAPALINGYYFDTRFDLYYSTAMASFIFILKSKGLRINKSNKNSHKYRLPFVISSLFVAAGSFIGNISAYFLGPMVALYVANLNPKEKNKNNLFTIVFFTSFAIYIIYGWSGYGRTVTAGYGITCILAYCMINNLKINKLIFGLLGFLGALLLVSRKEWGLEISIERSIDDSAIGPYRLASEFIKHFYAHGYDFSGFLDQLIFSAFSFVPRELWPTKPFGFGFQYVVDNMSDYLADSGHSIASTLIADHFYYLGWLGFFSGIAVVWLVASLIRHVYAMKIFDGYIYVIFAANMMVFVWGGMTSFSARIIYPLIGLIPFLILNRCKMSNYKMVA